MDTNNKLFFELPQNRPSAIKVIGVGGGGSNAVGYMYDQGISGVDFIICNTDAQALVNNPIPNKIQLGNTITEGLGAGANPEIGEQAALESMEDIKNILGDNTKMVFVTAGMGGGTGTGAAPVIAGIAKEMGILTVGIVTIPFSFEGKTRMEQAEKGLEKVRNNVDSLIIVKNDKLRELYGNLGYKSGFSKSNEILSTAAKGIAEVITKNYSINIDLKDAKTVLADSGTAIMGSAQASGPNKAQNAIMAALDSPLLNDNKITGAKNVLLLIVSGEDEITVDEIGIINDHIQAETGNSSNIIMGIGEEPALGENISVTVIATGFPVDDERNSGKEREKIIHTLNDDINTPKAVNINKNLATNVNRTTNSFTFPKQERKDDTTNNSPSTPSAQKIFTLEDEEEVTTFGISNKKDPIAPSVSFEDDINIIKREISPSEEKNIHLEQQSQTIMFNFAPEESIIEQPESPVQPTIFSLDEAEDFTQMINQKAEEIQKAENPTNTFNSSFQPSSIKEEKEINAETDVNNESFNQMMEKKIQERRERLKKLNSKFQDLSKQNIDDVEKIPAYKRQGIDLDENIEDKSSNVYYDKKSNEIQIRPNNFFHDNVD